MKKELENISQNTTLEPTNLLKKEKDSLSKQDKEILDLKYAAKRFGDMDETELGLVSRKILLVIHTVTGWVLPVDILMDVLVGQFQQKMKESYANLNEKEFEYAFRNRGMDVKDWGKSINLSLIDEIIIPYMESRIEVSNWEEQKKNKLLSNTQPQETIDVVEMIERWRIDPNLNMLLIPLFFYDFLFDTGIIKITDEEKWEWWRKAKESIKAELLAAIPECKTTDALNEWKKFEESERTKKWDDVMFGRIGNRAKRLIVYDYLTKK